MGQYYVPINLNLREYVLSYDFNNGMKLMEHSYVGNEFVGVIMELLTKGKRWYRHKIVWCGDYADEIKAADVLPDKQKLLAEILDSPDTLYDFIRKNGTKIKDIKPMELKRQDKAILVNHTFKEYVKYTKLKNTSWGKINPLPLLTAVGNGRGGGDYNGENMNMVGLWMGCSLSVEFKIPKGYLELGVEFSETY